MDDILEQVCALGGKWHEAGTVPDDVLRAVVRLAPKNLAHTAETGTGRTTLLLSRLSQDHIVFTFENPAGDINNSDRAVRDSPLLNGDTVHFVFGPSQVTVPQYQFSEALDLVLIDGPHGFPFPILEYYYLYPHIRPGGLLVVDDIQIPATRFLYDYLRTDDMWHEVERLSSTAFFVRTDAPTFPPLCDGWWLQGYNKEMYDRMMEPEPAWRLWARSHLPEWAMGMWRSLRRRG
jgi:predicted O-methyltransferase YrrM